MSRLFSLYSNYRFIRFTINHPDKDDLKKMYYAYKVKIITFVVYQYEEVSTLHVEGYCEFSKKQSGFKINKIFPRAHLEKRMGTKEQCIMYCTKENSRVKGPYQYGTPVVENENPHTNYIGSFNNDIANQELSVREIQERYPNMECRYPRYYMNKMNERYKQIAWNIYDNNMRFIRWVCGESGIGKTTGAIRNHRLENLVHDEYRFKDPFVWRQTGGSSKSLFIGDYQGEESVIIDDFSLDWFNIDCLKSILDQTPIQLHTKGGYIWFIAINVTITSVKHPKYIFDSNVEIMRRIHKVFDLDNDYDEEHLNQYFKE